jgi:predicted phage tail protein
MNAKRFGLLVCLVMLCTLPFAGALAETAAAPQGTAIYVGESAAITAVTLRVVTLDGEILFDGPVLVVDDNPTVSMALLAAADAAGLTLDVSGDTADTMFLNGVNDLVSENPAFWMYYINQAMAELGMGTQPIAQGDLVEFIYGDYNVGYQDIQAK